MTETVRIDGLVHDYGHGPVLEIDHLHLEGARVHVAGPNGAGKTTLLDVLASLTTPTQGRVHVAGHPLPEDARAARAEVGYAGHTPSLHTSLPAKAALGLHADLHEIPAKRVTDALDTWGLASHARTRVSALSHGQAQRLDLARAFLHAPRILLLDEPTTGLDDDAIQHLSDRLEHLDPQLVLIAAPQPPPLAVEKRLTLPQARLEEASP